jgi:predicted transcriptional regulator
MGCILVTIKTLLHEIAASRKGIKPAFEPAHVIKALLILYEREPIGRNTLSKMLGLQVTSTRTLIRRMKEYELLLVDVVGGCYLTEGGKKIVEKILSVMPKIVEVTRILGEDIRLAKCAWACVVRQGAVLIQNIGVVNVRDKIIAHGSKAALIIFISNGHAYLPPERLFDETRYSNLKSLREFLAAENGDAIIISFSEDPARAEIALLNAVIDLFLDVE